MAYFGTEFKSAKIVAKRTLENTLKLFYAKSGSKNAYYSKNDKSLEKWQKWPYCMGYSEAKWPFLGRNLKVPKS